MFHFFFCIIDFPSSIHCVRHQISWNKKNLINYFPSFLKRCFPVKSSPGPLQDIFPLQKAYSLESAALSENTIPPTSAIGRVVPICS